MWVSDDLEETIVVGSVEELERLSGVTGLTDIHKDIVDKITIPSKMGKGDLKRTEEVFDCWFESGSMPYASFHYPFENKEFFEAHFPADFIAEGLDQTRGWFYTLMVLSTALFDKPAFKNNIVNGLVLAGDGKKMSKRLKNYDDPMKVVNEHSADALRLYLINSPVVRAEPLKFNTEGVKGVVKDVFLPWYNAYRFFVQSVQGMEHDTGKTFVPASVKDISGFNTLDKWLQAACQSLMKFVKQEMEGYRLYTVIPKLLGFIEHLTNWYIKLNRGRLKGEEGVEVRHTALSNLGSVLTQVAVVMAPFTPHLSELMYQNLRLLEPEDQREDSVHFKLLPEVNESAINEEIEIAVGNMQAVIQEGRKIRERRTVSLKTPLKCITICHRDQSFLDSLKDLTEYIQGELNVFEVKFTTAEDEYVSFKVEPNRKVLGQRLGKEAKECNGLIAKMSQDEMVNYLAVKDTTGITLGKFTLTGDDINVLCKPKEGLPPQCELSTDAKTNSTMMMDVTVERAQLLAGTAREFKAKVQKLRKTAGVKEQDVIEVFYKVKDSAMNEALATVDMRGLLKVLTVAPISSMPKFAVPIYTEEIPEYTIVLARAAAAVDRKALEAKWGVKVTDAIESFVCSLEYDTAVMALEGDGLAVGLGDVNHPDLDGQRVDVQLTLGKDAFLCAHALLEATGGLPKVTPGKEATKPTPAAPAPAKTEKAPKEKKEKAPKEKKEAKPKADGGKKKEKGGKKEEKAADPEAEAKAAAKKLKAVEKEGGKKGVEIEGASEMGGLAYFCTTVSEPDGDMALLEASFASMNAIPDPDPEEERRGGAGGVGKMCFSAGVEFLQIVSNVPAELQVDKEMDGKVRKAMNAKDWIQHVLDKFAKESPGLKAEGDASFAKGSIPANKDMGFFPLKIKDDAMSFAYGKLREFNCFNDDASSDGPIPVNSDLDDY